MQQNSAQSDKASLVSASMQTLFLKEIWLRCNLQIIKSKLLEKAIWSVNMPQIFVVLKSKTYRSLLPMSRPVCWNCFFCWSIVVAFKWFTIFKPNCCFWSLIDWLWFIWHVVQKDWVHWALQVQSFYQCLVLLLSMVTEKSREMFVGQSCAMCLILLQLFLCCH